ncbi:MAG TPA: glycosyl hydrolase 53 family protein [Asticcacaulis sp.]|nr:glycosyl hydrolase 53 family protein [Asticcacaulis sp.]
MKTLSILALGVALAALSAPAHAQDYAYGADIGWVTQEEAEGVVFRDATGAKADPYVLLKNLGINAIRLRVWVNPAKGWNGKQDLLVKAKRAQANGQKVMLDFHYSDNWADPQKQFKPAAWAGHDVKQLAQDVGDHTRDVLSYLKANGIDVAWVQVGNEITNGLLWPDGKTDHFDNITAFTNAGYDAVKAVYPDAQVVLHIDNGWDGDRCRRYFDNFFKAGGKTDIIGLSYYPYWSKAKDWKVTNPMLGATMTDLVARYNKPIMVVETGFQYDDPDGAKAMLSDVIARNKALGDKGLGVFYWEPDADPKWTKYQLGAMNDKGQFTAAMDAFKH